MTFLHRLTSIVRWIVRRDSAERDLNDELETFVDMVAAERMRDGAAPEEAHCLAVLHLGGVEQAKERVRTGRHGARLEEIGRDVRYAAQSLRRNPVFAIAAILTLGCGIGANAALLSVTRGVLLKTLPVDRPEQLVEIGCINPMNPEDACRTHYPGFLMFRERTDVLAGVFAFAATPDLAADLDGRPEIVSGLMLSGNAYTVLGRIGASNSGDRSCGSCVRHCTGPDRLRRRFGAYACWRRWERHSAHSRSDSSRSVPTQCSAVW